MSEWKTIESAPKGAAEPYGYGPEILGIYVGDGWVAHNIVRWRYHKNPPRGSWRGPTTEWEPSHWMPLPAPPQSPAKEA